MPPCQEDGKRSLLGFESRMAMWLLSVLEDHSGCSVEKDERKPKGGTSLFQEIDEEGDGWVKMVGMKCHWGWKTLDLLTGCP